MNHEQITHIDHDLNEAVLEARRIINTYSPDNPVVIRLKGIVAKAEAALKANDYDSMDDLVAMLKPYVR